MRQHNSCQSQLREAPSSITCFVQLWFIWSKRSLPSRSTTYVHVLHTLKTDNVHQLAGTSRNKKAGEEKNNDTLVAEKNILGYLFPADLRIL